LIKESNYKSLFFALVGALLVWYAYKLISRNARLHLSRARLKTVPVPLPSSISRWEGEGGHLAEKNDGTKT
jgi:hypothetical protein